MKAIRTAYAWACLTGVLTAVLTAWGVVSLAGCAAVAQETENKEQPVTSLPEANIIGKFDADLVFFVEWPSQKAFAEFVQDPGYLAIRHLREEAIRDSLLVRCKKK